MIFYLFLYLFIIIFNFLVLGDIIRLCIIILFGIKGCFFIKLILFFIDFFVELNLCNYCFVLILVLWSVSIILLDIFLFKILLSNLFVLILYILYLWCFIIIILFILNL